MGGSEQTERWGEDKGESKKVRQKRKKERRKKGRISIGLKYLHYEQDCWPSIKLLMKLITYYIYICTCIVRDNKQMKSNVQPY